MPLEIPRNASGTLRVLVTDGPHLAQWEQREMRKPQEIQSIAQVIRTLNEAPRNSRLYVRLLRSDAGAVVGGETLSSLPPSVLAVLEGERGGSSFTSLRTATAGAWDLPSDYVLSGSRVLTITVDQK